jgi:hypothetical protein
MLTRNGWRFSACRSLAWAAMAGLVLTMAEPQLALAGSQAPGSSGVSVSTASSAATDFSSARRHRHYRRGGNAAGLAFMGMALGSIAAFAEQQRREDCYYNGCGYNGYAPGYYGGGPYYHGGGPYYGHRYYRRY